MIEGTVRQLTSNWTKVWNEVTSHPDGYRFRVVWIRRDGTRQSLDGEDAFVTLSEVDAAGKQFIRRACGPDAIPTPATVGLDREAIWDLEARFGDVLKRREGRPPQAEGVA